MGRVTARRLWLQAFAIVIVLGIVGSVLLNVLDPAPAVTAVIFVGLVAIAGLIGGLTAERLPPPPQHR